MFSLMIGIVVTWFAVGLLTAMVYCFAESMRSGQITLGDLAAMAILFLTGPIPLFSLFGTLLIACGGEMFNNIHMAKGMDKVVWNYRIDIKGGLDNDNNR